MTQKQREQFNLMRSTLLRITRDYLPSERLLEQAQRRYGLEPIEALEMAYDNIQAEAKAAVRGVRPIEVDVTQRRQQAGE